jgi:HlyD family secretion protein
MDISRPDLRRQKLRYRFTLAAIGLTLVVIAAWFILRLKPAVPTVDSAVWTDTVKRGPFLRQVFGPGSLVAREDRPRQPS